MDGGNAVGLAPSLYLGYPVSLCRGILAAEGPMELMIVWALMLHPRPEPEAVPVPPYKVMLNVTPCPRLVTIQNWSPNRFVYAPKS